MQRGQHALSTSLTCLGYILDILCSNEDLTSLVNESVKGWYEDEVLKLSGLTRSG